MSAAVGGGAVLLVFFSWVTGEGHTVEAEASQWFQSQERCEHRPDVTVGGILAEVLEDLGEHTPALLPAGDVHVWMRCELEEADR